MADETGGSEHSVLCLRLMQLFPRVTRGMRRWQDRAAPAPSPLSPRHVAALEQIRGGPLTVGEMASGLGLTLPTVSGVLADLDRAGLVERRPDPADRSGNGWTAPPSRWPASWKSSPRASSRPSSRPWTCSKASCAARTSSRAGAPSCLSAGSNPIEVVSCLTDAGQSAIVECVIEQD